MGKDKSSAKPSFLIYHALLELELAKIASSHSRSGPRHGSASSSARKPWSNSCAQAEHVSTKEAGPGRVKGGGDAKTSGCRG